jgi:flagellar protein FlaG
VAGVVAIMAVINAVLPAVGRTSGALVATADVVDQRISSQIEIIHATGEVGTPTAHVWVKNVGAATQSPLDMIDLFFGPEDDFSRIPYGGASCTAPCWEYDLENDTTWVPTATLHISIHWDQNLQTGVVYYVKVVSPNGVDDAKLFTL